jgi:hypothetical protein
MDFIDILNRYASRPPDQLPDELNDDFDQVAHAAPPEVVSEGIADAFRDDQTPPFQDMVAQLFEHSDAHQRAGLLNQILGAVGPAALSGGPLQDLFRHYRDGSRIPDEDADRVSPAQVRDIARQAREHNPGVIERVSSFYARHPELVRNLGRMAMGIALRNMARRSRH